MVNFVVWLKPLLRIRGRWQGGAQRRRLLVGRSRFDKRPEFAEGTVDQLSKIISAVSVLEVRHGERDGPEQSVGHAGHGDSVFRLPASGL